MTTRDYKGLNVTRLQILDALEKENSALDPKALEKAVYGDSFHNGPYFDLFLRDVNWLVEQSYVFRHTHDAEGNKLRFYQYEITENGEALRKEAHKGWIGVVGYWYG